MEDPLAVALGALDLVPTLAHATRGASLGVTEHVRVPANELFVDEPRDGLEVVPATLLQQQGEEVDLEQEVAELVRELGIVARNRRVGHFVCLLDGVRNNRALGLLAVPGTVPAQALRQRLQVD